MVEFDYSVSAQLFPSRNRKHNNQSLRYRRFARAADAIRFAIEEPPPDLLVGAFLEVDGKEIKTADRFVACTRAPTIPYPAARRSKANAEPYAQRSCLHPPSHSCKQGPSRRRGATMTKKTIDLDQHRGMAAQKATELRRLSANVEANEKALRLRQDELEARLLAAPAANWPEAAEKARYLLKLFAASLSAQDPRRQKLIAAVLRDFERLARK